MDGTHLNFAANRLVFKLFLADEKVTIQADFVILRIDVIWSGTIVNCIDVSWRMM